eukprot:TRINITY_DN28951_c0_g1_i1.p1 TRINITY_DN28951_c0_g1~~TRINITY_DN28951_c0_g1_i1.p1  ORF type:complete len:315 (+),score=61.61 TRINITY_DN28951_c0_g1_i1:35-979(+)
MIDDVLATVRSITPRRRRVVRAASASSDGMIRNLERTNEALAVVLGQREEEVGVLMCRAERERHERQVITNSLEVHKGREDRMGKELGRLRKDLEILRTEHQRVLMSMEEQEGVIMELRLEVQKYRDKELGRLRQSVGQAVRAPIRDRARCRVGSGVPRDKKAADDAFKEVGILKKKVSSLDAELSALRKENEILATANTRYATDIKELYKKNDTLTALLTASSNPHTSVSYTALSSLLTAAAPLPQSAFKQTLTSLSNNWSPPGGVEHNPPERILEATPAELEKFVKTEEHKLDTIRKLVEMYRVEIGQRQAV